MESSKAMDVLAMIERPGQEKTFWRRIGKAFTNRDGSINVYLDALPTNGKLQLREEQERRDDLGMARGWIQESVRRDPAAMRA